MATEPTPEQMQCGRVLYGPPASCTCGTCMVSVRATLLDDCRELITDNDGKLKLAICSREWEEIGERTLSALNGVLDN